MFNIYFRDIKELKNNRWDTNYWGSEYLTIIEQIKYFRVPIKRLSEIAYITMGQSGKRTFIKDEGVQYLIVGNLIHYGVDYKYRPRYVEENAFNDPPRSRVENLDILLAISGSNSIGRVTMALDVNKATNISQDIALIRLGNNPFSVLLFLQSKWGQSQILRLESGTGVTHLSQQEVRDIVVPILDNELETWCKEQWLLLHSKFNNASDLEELNKERLKLISIFENKVNKYIRKY